MLEEVNEGEVNGSLVVGFVVDEEFCGRGLYDLLTRKYYGTYNLVVEPTNLHICPSASGCIEYKLKIYGVSGHGAVYGSGDNAIIKATKVINKLVEISDFNRRGSKYMEIENLNIGKISGGFGGWIVPPYVEIDILHHYLPDRTFNEIKYLHETTIERICRSLGIEYDIDYLHSCEGFISQLDDKLDNWIKELKKYLKKEVAGHMPSESDANLLYHLTGNITLVFGPGDIKVAHSSREYIDINDVIRAGQVLKSFAYL